MDWPLATKTEKEKKRKCSVLTKHVKEYIKKEEEDKKKKKKTKKKKKPKKNKLLLLKSLFFLLAVTRFTSFRTFDRDKLIYTRLGYTIIGDDAYLLGFK